MVIDKNNIIITYVSYSHALAQTTFIKSLDFLCSVRAQVLMTTLNIADKSNINILESFVVNDRISQDTSYTNHKMSHHNSGPASSLSLIHI